MGPRLDRTDDPAAESGMARENRTEDPSKMVSLIAQTHWDSLRTLGLAVILLAGGAVLLLLPRLRRWGERLARGQPARPPTIGERIACIEAAAKAHDDLTRATNEARNVIRAGCEQLDSRLAHLEKLLARIDAAEHSVRGHAVDPPAGTGGLASRGAYAGAASIDPLSREVFALADAGRSPVQIAQATGEHVGKVELMLALRRV